MEVARPKINIKNSTPPSSATSKKIETHPTPIDSARIEKNKKITQKPPLSGKSIAGKSTSKSKSSEPLSAQKQLSREISYDILSESTQTTNTNLSSMTANEFNSNNNNNDTIHTKSGSSNNFKTNTFDSKLEINSSRIDLVVKPSSAKSIISNKSHL